VREEAAPDDEHALVAKRSELLVKLLKTSMDIVLG
jgi:hypothetical protein